MSGLGDLTGINYYNLPFLDSTHTRTVSQAATLTGQQTAHQVYGAKQTAKIYFHINLNKTTTTILNVRVRYIYNIM